MSARPTPCERDLPEAEVLIHACRGVDFTLPRGKTLAIVESESGRPPRRGCVGCWLRDWEQVLFRANPQSAPIGVHAMNKAARTAFQKQAQMVFQDRIHRSAPAWNGRDD